MGAVVMLAVVFLIAFPLAFVLEQLGIIGEDK